MNEYRLFMLLLGCRYKDRNTEQHDVFFGVAKQLRDLVPAISAFWKGSTALHVDAWRMVQKVQGYTVRIAEHSAETKHTAPKLFFLNLGGYKPGEFEEFHYKMLTVAGSKIQAAADAKETAFYLHTGFGKSAQSHIDDRYGVDVDDIFEIKDILPPDITSKFSVIIEKDNTGPQFPDDEIHLGFFKLQEL